MDNKTTNIKMLVLVAFGFSGAAALIYEVAWTRLLSLILGSTTYALSTMLGTFMAGLALGGYLGGKLADRNKNLLFYFGLMELGIGAAGLLVMPVIGVLPPLYLTIYKTFRLSIPLFFVFQFVLCSLVMIVPTTLMGMTFPVVARALTTTIENAGKGVGSAYSFNTLGAIAGSISAGFLLIPFVGVKATVFIAALLNIMTGLLMLTVAGVRLQGRIALLAMLGFGALLSFYFAAEEEWPVTYYLAHKFERADDFTRENMQSTILFKKDYSEGRVKMWRDRNGLLILQTGGKIEGTAESDIVNTRLLAYLPIASHPRPQSFLNIGLGAGITLASAKEHIGDLSLVEINRGVIDAIAAYGPPGLLDGVDITVQDARNYLFLSDKRFDVISSEPSYPTETSTANLFTREFYQLAAAKLHEGGIYCQWLPYYALSNDDVTMMLRTFGSVFPHVYLWKVRFDLLMVGSLQPFSFSASEIEERTQRLNRSGQELKFVLSRVPEQVRQIIGSEKNIPLNTDDKPFLEFHAARNFITGVED
jgi:spermidine synthase